MYLFQPSHKHSALFSMIHNDVLGPSQIKNFSGTRWFITFINDHTRLCWVYLLKEISETEQVFKTFDSMVKTQFQTQIQILRMDNGSKYSRMHALGAFLQGERTIHQSSCVETAQQNGLCWLKEKTNTYLRLLSP